VPSGGQRKEARTGNWARDKKGKPSGKRGLSEKSELKRKTDPEKQGGTKTSEVKGRPKGTKGDFTKQKKKKRGNKQVPDRETSLVEKE